jgi:tryptophanyl-tRNA synthetase
MFDSPEEIRKKLSKAVTATDAPEGEMPKGVKNLFDLLLEFGNQEAYDTFTKQYQDGVIKYSELKEALADTIAKYFAPMREIKQQLDTQDKQIDKIIADGAFKANKIAQSTIAEVKGKIGLI